jgi:hypothetical protein
MSGCDGAAAQYNRVLSIMRDTMDKTLFDSVPVRLTATGRLLEFRAFVFFLDT